MVKIDLDIDAGIPEDVKAIILRAEQDAHNFMARPIDGSAERFAHIISQMIQQAFYVGQILGREESHKTYSNLLAKIGKAAQS